MVSISERLAETVSEWSFPSSRAMPRHLTDPMDYRPVPTTDPAEARMAAEPMTPMSPEAGQRARRGGGVHRRGSTAGLIGMPVKLTGIKFLDSIILRYISSAGTINWKACCRDLMDATLFQSMFALLILANAICIGLETDQPHRLLWTRLEYLFLACFTLEFSARVWVHGLPVLGFTWHVFDGIVVLSGIADILFNLVSQGQHQIKYAPLFRIVRLLRVLRIFRILRTLKQLYLLAYGFVEGAMAVVWVAILSTILMYVCSIVVVHTFGRTAEDHPQHEFLTEKFGTIPRTMLSLFELISQPDLRPYHEAMAATPSLVPFLVTFVVFGSFGLIALLTGVISESIFEKNQFRIEEERMDRELKHRTFRRACAELFDRIDADRVEEVTSDQLIGAQEEIMDLLEMNGAPAMLGADFEGIFKVFDVDHSGTVDKTEFVQGMLQLSGDVRPMSIMELSHQMKLMAQAINDIVEDRRIEAQRTTAIATHTSQILERQLRLGSKPGEGPSARSGSHNSGPPFMRRDRREDSLSSLEGGSRCFPSRGSARLVRHGARAKTHVGNIVFNKPASASSSLLLPSVVERTWGDVSEDSELDMQKSSTEMPRVQKFASGRDVSKFASEPHQLMGPTSSERFDRLATTPPETRSSLGHIGFDIEPAASKKKAKKFRVNPRKYMSDSSVESFLETNHPTIHEGSPLRQVSGTSTGDVGSIKEQVCDLLANHFHVLVEAQRRAELSGSGSSVAAELAGLAEALAGLQREDAQRLDALASQARARSPTGRSMLTPPEA